MTEQGLVVPPQQLECQPSQCEVVAKFDRCFIDRHHLYWPHRKFSSSPLAAAFRAQRFNSINLHRCQHNDLHRRFDESAMPSSDLMASFLDEAELLERLGVVLGALESIELALVTSNKRKQARDPERYLDRYIAFDEESRSLQTQARRLEIIRPEVVTMHLGNAALALEAA